MDGKLSKVIDANGKVTNYNYTTAGYLTEIINNEGITAEKIDYKADGLDKNKVNSVTDIFGNKKTYAYSISNGTTITDSNGRSEIQKFDDNQYLISIQDAGGRTAYKTYEYYGEKFNKYGEEKTAIDRNGNKTEYVRDSITGNVTKEINQDLSYKLYENDSKNNLIKMVYEEAKNTYYIYDANKVNVIKEVKPLNGTDIYDGTDLERFAITDFEYYQNGLLKYKTDPEGNRTEYIYDQHGNLIEVIDRRP